MSASKLSNSIPVALVSSKLGMCYKHTLYYFKSYNIAKSGKYVHSSFLQIIYSVNYIHIPVF